MSRLMAPKLEEIYGKVVAIAGTKYALSKRLGVSTQAIYTWNRIPLRHVRSVSKFTGIPDWELRPDVFLPPETT
jgi:hypothetical protein